ncbi:type I phosphomannose isomerase catalytic subunit [Halanaerobacter jeridensis]|uniref:Phosphohexomutase n=1 Tax=Halanaerobacter jeridensis TaxID=706427 RepID=A0A939BP82_9FIRM|nr:type I phosphomannose isomerase catalytic subunit [Halanaerobacter jeridensis]MBM7556687.1 mannose-6-phosphate isomerase [Halanaerobacter jeridensis]
MEVLKFKAVYKKKIWGGRKLATKFNRQIPEGNVGESWELAAHEHGSSTIANGQYQGQELMEVVAKEGKNLLGTAISVEAFDKFPLLIKFLDINDKLSVQVHPDDQYAQEHAAGELGKTEMWYIMDAEEDAKLIYGIDKEVNRDEFAAAIEAGELRQHLEELSVEAGDVVFIPSGTVHSTLGGVLIAEIQQNSDTTYRVYDWNRVGDDGKPRDLHIESALDVIDFGSEPRDKVEGLTIEKEGYTREIQVACPYFTTETLDITTTYQGQANGERFYVLMGLEGSVTINYKDGSTELTAGETALIPADLGSYELKGDSKVIVSYIKDPAQVKEELKNDGYNEEELAKIAGLS